MSVIFPTDKDEAINELDDVYKLELTNEEAARLRRMTLNELLLVTVLLARARRNAKLDS